MCQNTLVWSLSYTLKQPDLFCDLMSCPPLAIRKEAGFKRLCIKLKSPSFVYILRSRI